MSAGADAARAAVGFAWRRWRASVAAAVEADREAAESTGRRHEAARAARRAAWDRASGCEDGLLAVVAVHGAWGRTARLELERGVAAR